MIDNYRMLTAGGVCLFLSMLFGLSFPHPSPFGELLLRAVGIPPYSNMETETGIHFAGLTSFFLLLAGLFFVNHSLNKYNGRAVLTALAAVFLIQLLSLHTRPLSQPGYMGFPMRKIGVNA